MIDKPIQKSSVEEAGDELMQNPSGHRWHNVLFITICVLVVITMLVVLLVFLWMPVLKIYGNSMMPALHDGNIVLAVKTSDVESGDVIAFYYNNKILIKRVIAKAGDVVNIEDDGSVFVNGKRLEESYLTEKALGECNIDMPYQVPKARVFVMGDSRSVSVDSRNMAVGCVAEEQMIGRIALCIWPLNEFGKVK